MMTMYNRKRYRPLDRTLVVDARVRSVLGQQNSITTSNSTAVGVPQDAAYMEQRVVVGPKGYELPPTQGLLFITTAEPIIMQLGTTAITINGQFILSGEQPACVLVSDVPQTVNVIQY